MTKNYIFRGQKIPQNSKVDPEPCSPALLQIARQPTDPNEILSLVSWIKDCSNHGFIYIYIQKLEMINYICGMKLENIENLLLFQSNKRIK